MVEPRRPRIGPNGKPVRPFVMPTGIGGKLMVWRLLILRRIVQLSTLLLFFGSAHWAWNIAGQPLIQGNLSSSEVLGIVPLADPFAALQIFFTQHLLKQEVVIGALIVAAFYALVGGRVWCSWVCPINMVTDSASWLRRRLKIPNAFKIERNTRYWILMLTLLLSAITGLAAFEWISPISMFHREVIFGLGLGWTSILGIFIFDLLIVRHGWCGHLCPLGAFYAVLGKVSLLRVSFDAPTCTQCCECAHVCPEPQVFDFKKAHKEGMITSPECSNCGRCITVCPENTLKFDIRSQIIKQSNPEQQDQRKIV